MRSTTLIFAVFAAYFAIMRPGVTAQKAPTPFSTYGEIQSVQKYSSNPFWNKDSPYNQRMPTPIYATGADLTTGDCNRVVANLVASYCAFNNNCTNKKLSDVRPTVMVQLSQLPGHNFATSCGGYIDSEFENYKKTYGNVSQNNVIKPTTNKQTTKSIIQTDNLFKQQPSKAEQAVADRAAELQRLQALNTPAPVVTQKEFPKTIDDLSFTDRMALASEGYEPYKDKKSYIIPDFKEEDEEFFERLKKINPTEFCRRRPKDSYCQPKTTSDSKDGDGDGNGNGSGNGDGDGEGENPTPCDNPGSTQECPIKLKLN